MHNSILYLFNIVGYIEQHCDYYPAKLFCLKALEYHTLEILLEHLPTKHS